MLLECGRCGAPLDVRGDEAIVSCRYCRAQTDRGALRTIASRTPRTFVAPPSWSEGPLPEGSSIVLLTKGPTLIETVKLLRRHLDLGLRDAVVVVQQVPVLLEGVANPAACARELAAAGAEVRVGGDDQGIVGSREVLRRFAAGEIQLQETPGTGSAGCTRPVIVIAVLALLGVLGWQLIAKKSAEPATPGGLVSPPP